MNPWTVDAREAIKDAAEIDYDLIELNEGIGSFLNGSNLHFVIGTKGFGKSLLLLAKRKKLSNLHLIPEHEALDVPHVKLTSLDKEALSRLQNRETLVLIWSLSLVIAIIKRLDLSSTIMDMSSPSLKEILSNPLYFNVSSVFDCVLTDINRRDFYEDLSYDYNKTLIPLARTIRTPVAVFIDNVDECFQGVMDIWYEAQISLIKAIYDLIRRRNRHLHGHPQHLVLNDPE